MPTQFDPPSGTRDFLAAEVGARERAFAVIRSVFSRYGFEPLQTPAFERLDVLLGKYGEEGDKLIFKILRRGEHEASGEADLALRYDMTVPLARVASAYGSQLPTPYKRYAMGPVWRADRPGRGRFREFVQCDLDTLGTASVLADAEVICAVHDTLAELGVPDFRFLLNSRHVLAGLLEAFGVPGDLGPGVLISLDKLDKMSAADVTAELTGRGLAAGAAGDLVAAMTAPDAEERIRAALKPSDEGSAGLDEVDEVLSLVTAQIPGQRIAFTPRLVRGLSYYTGPIWEVVADGVPGSISSGGRYDHLIEELGGPDVPGTGGSLGIERILLLLPDGGAAGRAGRLDVAVTVLGREFETRSFSLAAAARQAGLRASVYMGSSGKLGRQLKWASDQGARWALIYGRQEEEAGAVTVRDMDSGEQAVVPVAELPGYLAGQARDSGLEQAGQRASQDRQASTRRGLIAERRHRAAPRTPARWRSTSPSMSWTPTGRPSSAVRLVTPASRMPHGTNRLNQSRSQSQFRAKPCMVTPRDTRIPIAAIFRSGWPGTHTSAASLDPDGADSRVRAGPHQRFLDGPHVGDHVNRLAEPDDRVPDELPGAVPGDLAAPVHLDHRRPRVAQRPVERAGPLPGREHRLVLQQQARIRDLVVHPLPVDLALQLPAAQVGNGLLAEAEMHVDQLVSHAAHDIRGPGRQLPATAPANSQ